MSDHEVEAAVRAALHAQAAQVTAATLRQRELRPRRERRVRPALIVAVGVAAVVIGVGVVARAGHDGVATTASPTPVTSSSSSSLACRGRALTVGTEPISPQTGEHGVIVTFTNPASSACSLQGYPRIALVAGTALAFGYAHATGSAAGDRPPPPVDLAPGGTAYLRVVHYRCDLGTDRQATAMYVTLAGETVPLTVPVPGRAFEHCTGQPDDPGNTITVSPFAGSPETVTAR